MCDGCKKEGDSSEARRLYLRNLEFEKHVERTIS